MTWALLTQQGQEDPTFVLRKGLQPGEGIPRLDYGTVRGPMGWKGPSLRCPVKTALRKWYLAVKGGQVTAGEGMGRIGEPQSGSGTRAVPRKGHGWKMH